MLSLIKRFALVLLLGVAGTSCEDGDGIDSGSLTGKGGSMARFAMQEDYLYAVDDEALNVYQLGENGGLVLLNHLSLGAGVETIFATQNYLYIGTKGAMFTYDIRTAPGSPVFVSSYSHVLACDPVVVQDTLAFVTIRTSSCRSSETVNTLDILDIKDAAYPTLVSSYSLESPYGLGVDGKLLFVCEGDFGLKIFDVSNPFKAIIVKRYDTIHAFDVIADEDVLIVTGKDGITQYSYADPKNIQRLSFIPIVQP